MSLRHLLTALLLLPAPPAVCARTSQGGANAAGGGAPCRVIRRLGHPFTKRADRSREVRYALLDTCPDPSRPAARAQGVTDFKTELDFRFTPLDWSKPAGRIDVTYRGRTHEDLLRIVIV